MEFDVCPDMVFEASWEVTNKCGGIHTVVTSKIKLMKANYGSYTLIGPLFDNLPADFTEQPVPEPYARAFSTLAQQGIKCVYGIWDVQGSPATILVDARGIGHEVDTIKKQLWESYGVDSLFACADFNEPLLWAWGVGKLLFQLEQQLTYNHMVGHFHEWLTGFATLYLDSVNSAIGTVFTTHATMLGRTLAANEPQTYLRLESVDADTKARELGIAEKHTTEKACAKTAKVFTTVSTTTAKECKAFFGRDPDILPNGLEIDLFPSFDEAKIHHLENREQLYDYVMTHFFPHYTFDLDKTLFYYYGGRYEYGNKGFDIMVESLARLNEQLQGSDTTVVMFFFIAWNAGEPKEELLENKHQVDVLQQHVREHADYFLQRITLSALLKNPNLTILPEEFTEDIQKSLVRREGTPLLCTHYIDENNDPTINRLREVGLTNKENDRVKVVFMPSYLDGNDPLLDGTYYEIISGCDLGLFPSFYEPWGYTPLESLALGVPAVTTNMAGFGQHIAENVIGNKQGIYILDRQTRLDSDELTANLIEYTHCKDKAARSRNAHALSTYADWRQLIRHYLIAHCKAIRGE